MGSMASTLAEIVAARSGRPLENKCLNVKTDKVRKLSKGGMSLKEQGRMQKEEQERRERESRKSSKAEILKTINTDAHARKNDPNWTSGVSAAAAGRQLHFHIQGQVWRGPGLILSNSVV